MSMTRFIQYKGMNFIPVGNHLNAYRNGNLIMVIRIKENMNVEDVFNIIDEQLEA